MAKMQIIEQFITKGVVLERESKNDAILCRAKYQICSLGEKNRNNRVYEKAVWDRVLADPDIIAKLRNKSLFFHAEHPTTTQSNTEKVAGVVTDINLNEKENKVYTVMEVLDTPYGRIVDTLLRAGCGIGVSTRADGELEEQIDEAGSKYQRVIPESYRFVTVDFTADPSSFGSEMPLSVQHNVSDIIKKGLDNEKIDREYATVLLEKMSNPEAVALLESIKNDKHHSDCKCKASEKKCTKGCTHVVESDTTQLSDCADKVYKFMSARNNKFNESDWKTAVSTLSIPMTMWSKVKILVQKSFEKLSEEVQMCPVCKTVYDTTYAQDPTRKCAKCGGVRPGVNPEAEVRDDKVVVNETQRCARCDKFIEDGKGYHPSEGHEIYCSKGCAEQGPEAEQITEKSGKCIHCGRKFTDVDYKNAAAGKESPVGDWDNICYPCQLKYGTEKAKSREDRVSNEKYTTSADISGQPANAKAAEKDMRKSAAKDGVKLGETEMKIDESAVKKYLTENKGLFNNVQEAIDNLVQVFKIQWSDARTYVEASSAVKSAMNNEKIQSSDVQLRLDETSTRLVTLTADREKLAEAYANDVVALTVQIKQLKEQVNKQAFEITTINSLDRSLKEQLEKSNENIRSLKEDSEKSVKALQEERTVEIKRITEANEVKIKELNEVHRGELLKIYVDSKLKSMHLQLPKQFLTILESCTSVEQVDAEIRRIQDQLREGLLQFNSLSEVIVKNNIPADPVQVDISRKVALALKAFGY